MALKHSEKIICPDCGKETATVSLEDFIMKTYTRTKETVDGRIFFEETLMVASDGTGIYECRERPNICNNPGGFMEMNHAPEELIQEEVKEYLSEGGWSICQN